MFPVRGGDQTNRNIDIATFRFKLQFDMRSLLKFENYEYFFGQKGIGLPKEFYGKGISIVKVFKSVILKTL